MKKVYLAGPTVFMPDAEARYSQMKQILSRYNLDGRAPLDNQVGLEKAKKGRKLGKAIYEADEGLMNSVDAAIFNTDPFRRGTEMDAGTAFEVGFCRARGLPMAAWRTELRHYPELVRHVMQTVFGAALTPAIANRSGGTSGEFRDQDGVLVHSSGYYQNLMIDVAIHKSGGETYADEDWELAFGRASARIAKLLDAS